jgi:hypothetical protein
LKEFHSAIIEDGYMNTEKAKAYAKANNITLPSNIFDLYKKND